MIVLQAQQLLLFGSAPEPGLPVTATSATSAIDLTRVTRVCPSADATAPPHAFELRMLGQATPYLLAYLLTCVLVC